MNKTICAILALAATTGALVYEYVNDRPPEPAPSAPSRKVEKSLGIGVIDPKRLIEADIYGDKFSRLDEREHFIRIELQNAMRPITLEEPTVESKPFDDSVWQKNAQTIIGEAAEIERRKKQAAEDYRKSTEERYLKRRDEINGQFLNEILNIKIKLQNAKVMRLTKEEIDALNARLEELQHERGQIQHELEQQWIQEIAAHADEVMQDDVAKLRAQAEESMERVKAQAREAQEAAQARNRAVMERSRALTERRELTQMLSNELEEILLERKQLEAQLIKDIEDETARLAIVNRLEAIILRRELDDQEKFYPYDFDYGFSVDLLREPKGTGAAIFPTASTVDLTNELIGELKTRR